MEPINPSNTFFSIYQTSTLEPEIEPEIEVEIDENELLNDAVDIESEIGGQLSSYRASGSRSMRNLTIKEYNHLRNYFDFKGDGYRKFLFDHVILINSFDKLVVTQALNEIRLNIEHDKKFDYTRNCLRRVEIQKYSDRDLYKKCKLLVRLETTNSVNKIIYQGIKRGFALKNLFHSSYYSRERDYNHDTCKFIDKFIKLFLKSGDVVYRTENELKLAGNRNCLNKFLMYINPVCYKSENFERFCQDKVDSIMQPFIDKINVFVELTICRGSPFKILNIPTELKNMIFWKVIEVHYLVPTVAQKILKITQPPQDFAGNLTLINQIYSSIYA
jgi:hypothetical protein